MKRNNFYTRKGVRGILDYVNGVITFIPVDKVDETNFDYPDESSCLTDEDKWDGQYNGETEIVETIVVNPQNTQKIVVAWVSEAYAESDEYERMLCTDTTCFYDWTSERTAMKDRIRKSIDKYGEINPLLEKEWKEIVDRYTNTCDWDLPSVEFIDLVKEAIDNA